MAGRTPPPADSEEAKEIVPDKTEGIGAILSAETPAVTGDGSEIKSRVKRNIITVPARPSANEIERDGTRYRRDRNGRWRPILY